MSCNHIVLEQLSSNETQTQTFMNIILIYYSSDEIRLVNN